MRKWRMGCPSNFPYNILKINNNNEYVFYSPIIRPIISTSLKPKKALSHFPALRVWDTGTRNKVVRFCVHRRADLTACKDKRNTYTVSYSYIPLHVNRVRYGSEFLPSNSGRTLISHSLSKLVLSYIWCRYIVFMMSNALKCKGRKGW